VEGSQATGYIGTFPFWHVRFVTATTKGSKKHVFVSITEIDQLSGVPFQANDLMVRGQFDDILVVLRLNNNASPEYMDQFCEIGKLQERWNVIWRKV